MGKVYNKNNKDAGYVVFGNVFRPSSPQPLDERTVVETFADLINPDLWIRSNTETRYEGIIVYVTDEQKPYYLIDAANPNYATSWKPVGSGDGNGEGTKIDSNDPDILITESGDTAYVEVVSFHGGLI